MTRDLRLHSEFQSSQHYIIRLIKRRKKGKERRGEINEVLGLSSWSTGRQLSSAASSTACSPPGAPRPRGSSQLCQRKVEQVQEEPQTSNRDTAPLLCKEEDGGRGPKEEVRGL